MENINVSETNSNSYVDLFQNNVLFNKNEPLDKTLLQHGYLKMNQRDFGIL